jgi:hypothetical protein
LSLTFGGRSLLFQQNVIPSSKGAELGAKDINHPVRLSYKPYFFSHRTLFSLTTNQRTVLSAMAF